MLGNLFNIRIIASSILALLHLLATRLNFACCRGVALIQLFELVSGRFKFGSFGTTLEGRVPLMEMGVAAFHNGTIVCLSRVALRCVCDCDAAGGGAPAARQKSNASCIIACISHEYFTIGVISDLSTCINQTRL